MKIGSGEDIAHLGELDQKLWTVLSCPVDGLEFDRQTLEFLDADKDGKIMVKEVVQAAEWLTSVIKDKDTILNGDSVLKLSNIDTSTDAGRRLYGSANRFCRISVSTRMKSVLTMLLIRRRFSMGPDSMGTGSYLFLRPRMMLTNR